MPCITMAIKRFLSLYFSNTSANIIRDKRPQSLLFLLRKNKDIFIHSEKNSLCSF